MIRFAEWIFAQCLARRIKWWFCAGSVLLLAPLAELHGQDGSGAIVGTIRDSLDSAVAGATVAIPGTGATTVSDSAGTYTFDRLSPGEARVSVRKLGFAPATARISVVAGQVTRADVTLSALAESLGAVVVAAEREVYESRLAGYNARRERAMGGHFITRESIENRHPTEFTDLLRLIPGVRIRPDSQSGTPGVRLRGSACPPLVFIDGFPATAGEFYLDTIDPSTVEGVEVYSGAATIPAEFAGPRFLDSCGVVAVWSRPARAADAGEPRSR